MDSYSTEHRPKCDRELVGVIETSAAIVGGIQFVVMKESSDRNWITCDACNETICKSCCIMPDSGYCNGCFIKYKIEPFIP